MEEQTQPIESSSADEAEPTDAEGAVVEEQPAEAEPSDSDDDEA